MMSGVPRTVVRALVAGAAALLPPSGATAQAPPTPRRLEGYCEGESCGFDYRIVACRPLALRARDTVAAPVVASLDLGDTAVVTTGNVVVRKPGVVVLQRDTLLATDDGYPRSDTLRLARGDTVHVLEYRELGHWTLWYRGRLTDGIEFWNGPGQAYFGVGRDSLPGRSVAAPVTETWLHLRGPSGAQGWWRRELEHATRPDWGDRCP
jgi:hypothetical protein